MTLEKFQKSNPPPALIPFFPPTDVAGLVRKLLVCVTLTALMAFLGRDKFFWAPASFPFQPEAAPPWVQRMGSFFKGVDETATFRPDLRAQSLCFQEAPDCRGTKASHPPISVQSQGPWTATLKVMFLQPPFQ